MSGLLETVLVVSWISGVGWMVGAMTQQIANSSHPRFVV